MKKQLLVSLISVMVLTLLMVSCSGQQFMTPAFYDKAGDHQIIAVLPFEMIFTGKKPKKLTVREVRKIEEAESLAFQESLYHSLMSQATKRRHPILVQIQRVERTNRILERNDISIRDSWEMDSEELARLLKVDAVVRTRVRKHRYMSQLASIGIEIGNSILNAILEETPLQIFVPNPTGGIRAQCQILNGRDGAILWDVDVRDETDWRMTSNEIINHVTYYFARKFPYRG